MVLFLYMGSSSLIGERFGMLLVIKQGTHKKVFCICDCGKETLVFKDNLIRENSLGCGCKRDEDARKRMTTHGMTKTKTYRSWMHAKGRCRNKSDKRYMDYGGRGITFCKEWDKFENFYRDMGEAPDGMSIDRIDNNKGYFKENCRWSDVYDQGTNKRNNVLIELDGRSMTASQWSRETGILFWTIIARVKRGFDPHDILDPNFGKIPFDGRYWTLISLLKKYNVPKTTFHNRRRSGMSIEESLTHIHRNKYDRS